MELVNKTTEWNCYRPEKEFSKGHLVFFCNDPNNLDYLKKTVTTANGYGRAMVETGLAVDYFMHASMPEVHIAPRNIDMNHTHMTDFMKFIKNEKIPPLV